MDKTFSEWGKLFRGALGILLIGFGGMMFLGMLTALPSYITEGYPVQATFVPVSTGAAALAGLTGWQVLRMKPTRGRLRRRVAIILLIGTAAAMRRAFELTPSFLITFYIELALMVLALLGIIILLIWKR